MPAPYAGTCLCGAVRYRLAEEPLVVYACHCTDCQKRTGSAFVVSWWTRLEAIALTQGEAALTMPLGADGAPRPARVCLACATRLWSEPPHRPGLAVVRAGTLEDTSWIRPQAHMWVRSAQPWVVIPPDVPRYQEQADFAELLAIGRR